MAHLPNIAYFNGYFSHWRRVIHPKRLCLWTILTLLDNYFLNYQLSQNIKLYDYFFALHQTVWGVPPASCDEQNTKLHDYFSRYIKLFEVCYLPVVMIKILSCMIIFCASHKTVWGVPPASCDEQNIKVRDYFFPVTSNCSRCVTRQLWWTKY